MSNYREFGRLLTEARESKGLSRTAVVRESGYVFSVYRSIEEGKKLATLKKFVELLGILKFHVEALTSEPRSPLPLATIGGTFGIVLAIGLGGTILTMFAAFNVFVRMAYYTCLYLWACEVEEKEQDAPAPLPLARALR